MTDLFLKVLEMSIMGSVVVLATILFRFLLRKRSKRFIMILWAVVAVRLLLPINIQSVISIFNYIPLHTDAITTQIQEAKVFEGARVDTSAAEIAAEKTPVDIVVNEAADEHQKVTATAVQNSIVRTAPDVKEILATIWFAGFAAVASYTVIRFVLLKIKLKDAVKIGRNVYESDKVRSPFVFGLFVPKIYLPEVLDNTEREYILMHERMHIRHGDWIGKILGVVIVAVHWFNPFVWLSYALFEQDIEMSCDESTVSKMTSELRQAYAISIVNYAKKSNNKRYLVTPLGFSNSGVCKAEVTHRVKNIISFKKGSKATSVLLTVTLLFVGAALGLNSKPVAAAEEYLSLTNDDFVQAVEAPVQREAPFDYKTSVPSVKTLTDSEKEISFYRDGKSVTGKLMTPETIGPYKTIVMCGCINSPSYSKVSKCFTDNGYAVLLIKSNLDSADYFAPYPHGDQLFSEVLDLYAVMDELRYIPEVDTGNLYLWGHQQGGYIAAYTGINRKSEIKGMFLVEPELEALNVFSESPKLAVKIFDLLPQCDVPVTIFWGTMLPNSNEAKKAESLLPDCKLIMLDGNSFSLEFDDEYAENVAKMTIEALKTRM